MKTPNEQDKCSDIKKIVFQNMKKLFILDHTFSFSEWVCVC